MFWEQKFISKNIMGKTKSDKSDFTGVPALLDFDGCQDSSKQDRVCNNDL